MKKYWIILAVLSMLFTAGVFTVHAAEETVYCERCNQDVSEDNWQSWNQAGSDIIGGHYRLTDDYFGQTDTIRIPEDTIVCLDLCGYTYSASNIRMFNIEGTFTIMDSKGNGLILCGGANGSGGGFAIVQSSGTFKLYGGTIRYSAVPGISAYNGALFLVDGGRVDIYNGTVAGGTVKATSSYNSSGGNFTIQNSGKLNIHGGTITQGIALKSDKKTAQGGNIYASSGAKVVISGGVIESGYSDAGGGNIFIAEATLIINSGEIRYGHALVSGGNIMANALTDVVNTIEINGGSITGGVAAGTNASNANAFARDNKGGGNIYERSPAGILKINGGVIDGDIVLDYVGSVTLSGSPKIGIGKNGGLVFKDLNKKIKADAKGLSDGAEIYIQASRVFTTNFDSVDDAQKALNYFKGAVRTTISISSSALQGTQGNQGICPHCGKNITWNDLCATDTPYFNGHCYLSSSLTKASNTTVSSDIVLDLNGYVLHQENRRFIFNTNSDNLSMTVMDCSAGGKFQGTATGNANGGLLYIYPNSTFELLSGTLTIASPINETTPSAKIAERGGVIYAANKATVNISGGVISGGSVIGVVTEPAENDLIDAGGNIYMHGASGKLSISSGIIKNGSAASLNGGNIYSAGPVDISGGVILNGAAKNGGNVYSLGKCDISSGIIINGNATAFAGNIYPSGDADIYGGIIAGGTATTGGGNIGIYAGKTNIYGNAVIIGGDSKSRGGNIALGTTGTAQISGGLISSGNATTRAGNIDTATETATINMDGGLIILGTSSNGGNLYINNGKMNLTGGNIVAGSAQAGGNIYMNHYVYVSVKDDGDSKTALPRISHGIATKGNGGNIYLSAADASAKYYLQLGNSIIRNGSATGNGNNIYVSENGVFTVLAEFSESTSVFFHESRNPVKGELLNTAITGATGSYPGELRLENINPNPMVCEENGKLRVIAAEIIMKDGTSLRFGSNEDAIRNYTGDAAYLLPNAGDLVLQGGNYTVDVAGQSISISGTGDVTCFDSANNNYENFGSVTVTGPTLVNTLQTVIDNKTYVTVLDNSTYSFHRLDMGVESISIRPANSGVYYSCTWNCDTTLTSKLKHFGVAVSIDHMPNSDFATDKTVLYTEADQDSFSTGKESNSVLITNILRKNNTQNDTRGRKNIFATPYITMENGSNQEQAIVALSESQAQFSLHDVMQLVDNRIATDPINYRRLTLPMRNFYETWKDDGMQTWELSKIPAPPEDDVIDVLMIGSSFCYYYVEELYGLAEAAGVKIRVCNAYYSGCKFEWHYTWWKQGKANYEFYQVTDNTGRKKTNAMSLEHCLAKGQWDVISIQESTSTIYNAGAQNHLDTTRGMRNELLGYLKEQFPAAKVYWHAPWAYQIGYKSGNKEVNTFEDQQERMMSIREFALGVCKENGVSRVNTGEAWQIYRKNYVGSNGLTDTLCARLGVGTNNVGDYYHDGDIGGGQYLNACVWFEIIMRDLRPDANISCIGNTYDPIYGGKYKLSQTLRTALQESAHQAVLEYNFAIPSTSEQNG